ncbi:LysR family transcriptional regulator [Paucilactobacillus suebicus]
MTKLTIDDLKSFVKLNEVMNVSDTAIQLSMTQSALSKRIQAMEKELGSQLISTKNKRHLVITESGDVLYRYAQTILTQFGLMEDELEQYRELKKGTLRIGSIPVMSQFGLMQIIDEFMTKFPQINISLEETEGEQLLTQLRSDNFDLGIIRDVQSNLLNRSQYEFIDLDTDELKVVLPVSHSLAKEKSLTINQLVDSDIATLQPGSGIYEIVNELFNEAGHTPNIRFTSTHIETLIKVVANANRATFLFNNSIKDLPRDQFVILPFTKPIYSNLQVVYHHGNLSQAGKRFVDFLINSKTKTTSD